MQQSVSIYIYTHAHKHPPTPAEPATNWKLSIIWVAFSALPHLLPQKDKQQNFLPLSQPLEGAGASMISMLCLQEVSTENVLKLKVSSREDPGQVNVCKN